MFNFTQKILNSCDSLQNFINIKDARFYENNRGIHAEFQVKRKKGILKITLLPLGYYNISLIKKNKNGTTQAVLKKIDNVNEDVLASSLMCFLKGKDNEYCR